MTHPGPARRPAQPQSQPPSSRSGGGLKLILALVAAVAVVVVLAFVTRGGDEVDTSTPKTDITKELKDAGFKKIDTKKHKSEEAGREVVTEQWERKDKAPEKVVISDDSPYTTPGVLIINAVTYTGSDGNGNLTCQPYPENARSPLAEVIADADKVRTGVKSGAIQADAENNPAGFPYGGEIVGCLP